MLRKKKQKEKLQEKINRILLVSTLSVDITKRLKLLNSKGIKVKYSDLMNVFEVKIIEDDSDMCFVIFDINDLDYYYIEIVIKIILDIYIGKKIIEKLEIEYLSKNGLLYYYALNNIKKSLPYYNSTLEVLGTLNYLIMQAKYVFGVSDMELYGKYTVIEYQIINKFINIHNIDISLMELDFFQTRVIRDILDLLINKILNFSHTLKITKNIDISQLLDTSILEMGLEDNDKISSEEQDS